MKPYSAKLGWKRDDTFKNGRDNARKKGKKEAVYRPNETVHTAEIDLIAHDAGFCDCDVVDDE